MEREAHPPPRGAAAGAREGVTASEPGDGPPVERSLRSERLAFPERLREVLVLRYFDGLTRRDGGVGTRAAP
jgi:hypothetical protein